MNNNRSYLLTCVISFGIYLTLLIFSIVDGSFDRIFFTGLLPIITIIAISSGSLTKVFLEGKNDKVWIGSTMLLIAVYCMLLVRQSTTESRICAFGEVLSPNQSLTLGGFKFERDNNDQVTVTRLEDKTSWQYDFHDTASAKYQFGDYHATLLVEFFNFIPRTPWYTRTMCVRVP